MAYNTYALTVLSYLCQFFWVPFKALRLEQRALARILRTPMHAFGLHGPFNLVFAGLKNCRSLLALNLSALFRASVVTLKGWEHLWDRLVKDIDLPSVECAHNGMISSWLSRPVASRLHAAYHYFSNCCEFNAPKHIIKFLHGCHENPERASLRCLALMMSGLSPLRLQLV